MSIRFAAAGTGASPAVARALRIILPCSPANDADISLLQDHLLLATLRHIARLSQGTDRHASLSALRAHHASDPIAFHHWLKICHQLGHPLADHLPPPII